MKRHAGEKTDNLTVETRLRIQKGKLTIGKRVKGDKNLGFLQESTSILDISQLHKGRGQTDTQKKAICSSSLPCLKMSPINALTEMHKLLVRHRFFYRGFDVFDN